MAVEKKPILFHVTVEMNQASIAKSMVCFLGYKGYKPKSMNEFILFASPLVMLNSLQEVHDKLYNFMPSCEVEHLRAEASELVLEMFDHEIPKIGIGWSLEK